MASSVQEKDIKKLRAARYLAIHLPPAPDPEIFGGPLLVGKMNAWALGLERKGMDEQKEKKAWVKRKRPFLFIEAIKLCASPLA